MKKAVIAGVCAAAIMICAVGLRLSNGYKETSFFAMDTIVNIKIKGSVKILEQTEEMVKSFDKKYDAYSDSSQVYRLNSKKSLTDEDIDIYKTALELCNRTDGVFDITIKPVKDLWSDNKVPDKTKLENAVKKVGYEQVKIEKNSVELGDGCTVDLGGIAKGYICDKVAEFLEDSGIDDFVLDMGGNIYVKREKGNVTVGVQEPFAERGEILYTVSVNGKSVVSSGTYERNFTENGKLYHHIYDTKTGYPVQNGTDQVTVIGEKSAVCDALSTAILAGGKKTLKKVLELYRVDVIAVKGKKIYKTDGIEIDDVKKGYSVEKGDIRENFD